MVGQQHIQAEQSVLHMLANIKMRVNTNYGMLMDSGGTNKTYGSLCYFTSYFTSIKC